MPLDATAPTSQSEYVQLALKQIRLNQQIKADSYAVIDSIVAAMTKQTAAAFLMRDYRMQFVCARFAISEKAFRNLGASRDQFCHQVEDELVAAHPYSTGYIENYQRVLVYYFGARGTGVLNNRIGKEQSAIPKALIAMIPGIMSEKNRQRKIKHLEWKDSDGRRHTIDFDSDLYGRNLDIIYRVNGLLRKVAEVKNGGDKAATRERFASALDVLRYVRAIDPLAEVAFAIRGVTQEIITECQEQRVQLFPDFADLCTWLTDSM